ncbi:MAG: hypothetical protein EXR79_05355 [Myxococcales bacterium]|nr:hypothetical protein [Myxococcales bacterium]
MPLPSFSAVVLAFVGCALLSPIPLPATAQAVDREVVAAPPAAQRSAAGCRARFDAGHYEFALPCLRELAAAPSEADTARVLLSEALAHLGRWDEAAKELQALAGDARGERSVVLARRINTFAEVEVGLAALVAGSPREALARLQSARIDAVSHGRTDERLRVPVALDLALGLALRAAGKGADARATLDLAAHGGGRRWPQLAQSTLARAALPKPAGAPWPWVARSIGDPEDEEAAAIAPLADGGLAIVARAHLGERSGDKLRLWSVDAAGRPRWRLTRGGAGDDVPVAAAGHADGGVVIAGWTTSQGAGDADLWLVRFGARHEVMHDVALGTPGREAARAVLALADGSVAAGSMGPTGQEQAWVVKVDAAGTKLWDRLLPARGVDHADAVVALPAGAVGVAGTSAGQFRLTVLGPDGAVRSDAVVGDAAAGDARVTALVGLRDGWLLAGTATTRDSMERRTIALRVTGGVAPLRTRWTSWLGAAPGEFEPAARQVGSGLLITAASAAGAEPTLAGLDERKGTQRGTPTAFGLAGAAAADTLRIAPWGKGIAVLGTVRGAAAAPRDLWLALCR